MDQQELTAIYALKTQYARALITRNLDQRWSATSLLLLGKPVTKHFAKSTVKYNHYSYRLDTIVNAFFSEGDGVKITSLRNIAEGTAFSAVWYQNVTQFTCEHTGCTQNYQTNNVTFSCTKTTCQCNTGTKMCGAPGGLDLSQGVNVADGAVTISCGTVNNATCNIFLTFLMSFFPDGLNLNKCVFGECANELDRISAQSDSIVVLDAPGIGGVALAGILCLVIIASLIFGIIDKSARKKMEVNMDRKAETLFFSNISYNIAEKAILKNITGSVSPGELFAIMGPSGAGKSSFIDILARKKKGGEVLGSLAFGNDESIIGKAAWRRITGFVDQEDTFLPSMTVHEVIKFSAMLRLPESMSKSEKLSRVDSVLKKLGLDHIAHSRVGDSVSRGISGGEKRRLSIGVELVTNPCLLFLDEPTSGLDSYNAAQVMKHLAALAHNDKKTIICTIHQPRADVFHMFDRVLLLSRGETAYFGPAKETAEFMSNDGYPCPAGYNIADHLLDLAAGVLTKNPPVVISENESATKDIPRNINETFIETTSAKVSTVKSFLPIRIFACRKNINPKISNTLLLPKNEIGDDNENVLAATFFTQLSQVFYRSLVNMMRNPSVFWFHFLGSSILGIFIGGVYFHVDNSLGGIQNRLGSIFFLQSLIGFSGLSSITTFTSERVLFMRERSNGFYGPIPFFITKVIFSSN